MTQDTWFMLEHTPRPGEVHPSLALTHEGRRVPPSLTERRRRRPEWNSDISSLSRGLGLRLDK